MRDAERTKARILDAAETLFARGGLEGASTEAIARHAGVSKTMLFYNFQNKEQLYLTVLKRVIESVMDEKRAGEIEAMEPADALRATVLDYFNIHYQRPSYAELTLREAMTYGGKYLQRLKYELPIFGQLMEIVQRGTDAGQFRKVDPVKTTLSIIGMTKIFFTFREALERVWEQDVHSEGRITEWRDQMIDLLVNGVALCPEGTAKPEVG
jgi:TetR/AcrR family transcriptional regulator